MPTHLQAPDAMDEVHALLAAHDAAGDLAPCRVRRLLLGNVLDEVVGVVADLLGHDGRVRVVLMVDPVRIARSGVDVKDRVEEQLAAVHDVRRVVLDDGHPELHVVAEVLDEATAAAAEADAVVAVGGGTISDIAKLAVARAEEGDGRTRVLVSVQTAASVDGYTDDVSVVLKDGVKRTVPSRWPDAVVADAGTIAEAPAPMNRAGFGEMTSMLTAPADWTLAHLVGAEPAYHDAPIRLLHAVGEGIDKWSPGVGHGDAAAVERLTRALAVRGIVTGVAGTTATLSGVEHLVSHMLDLHHAAHRLPTGLHGAQVGVAGLVAAAAWEMLDERLADTPAARVQPDRLDPGRARAAVEAAFGSLDPDARTAGECWKDYSAKLTVLAANRDRIDALLAGWEQHAPRLTALVRPTHELARGLRAASAAATFAELTPSVDDDLARWALQNCGLMRNRVTVVDLLALLGWWTPGDVEEVLDRAAGAAEDAAKDAAAFVDGTVS